MATVTKTATGKADEVDQIRRGMAQIRQRLHQDMQGVVAGAEAASDWKHYVRLYPWAALVGSFVIGYLVIPRRRRSVTKTAEKAAEAAIAKVAETADTASKKVQTVAAAPEKEKAKKGLIGAAFSLAMPLALKAAQGYALTFVENWIAQQQAAAAGPPPPPPQAGPRPAPRRPGG